MFCHHQGFLRIFTGHCNQISLVSFSITWLHSTTLTNMYLFLHNLLCTSTSNPSSGNFSLLWRATNIVSSPNRCLSSLIYNEKKQNIINFFFQFHNWRPMLFQLLSKGFSFPLWQENRILLPCTDQQSTQTYLYLRY